LQRLVFEWLDAGHLEAHANAARRLYRSHRDSMVAAIRQEMPDAAMAVPGGGYYVWLTLPAELDSEELARRAATSGVCVIPGSKFYAGAGPDFPRNEGPPRNRLRLTYSYCDEAQIAEGVRRLGAALRSMRN